MFGEKRRDSVVPESLGGERGAACREKEQGIDILRVICSFLVVCIHCPFPGQAGAYFTALTRAAVPAFFMVTGYYYSDMVKRGTEKKQIRKIFRMAVLSNLLYFLLHGARAMLGGELRAYLAGVMNVKAMVKFIVFNASPFSSHLWYLGAVLYVLLIALAVNRSGRMYVLCILAPFLLAGDLLLGKYSLLLWHRQFPVVAVRNFLFVGIPYFAIGMQMREKTIRLRRKTYEWLIVLFSITTLLERYLLVSLDAVAVRDHYISTTLLAMALFGRVTTDSPYMMRGVCEFLRRSERRILPWSIFSTRPLQRSCPFWRREWG